MTSTKHKANMKRKQMGVLTISNKNYLIYEGLNVIGRDAKATVLLKDVKFSKQHAVITVVDESTHFLSDFSSSNGTKLGNNCLVPYQLYGINDQDRVTFSDVLCLYHKIPGSNKALPNGNLSKINEELSETASHDAETQILPVGNKVLSNITSTDSQDLAPTQQIIDVHDAPTQLQTSNVCDNDDFIPPSQVCDMPTQIVDDKISDVLTNLSKPKPCQLVTSTQDDFSRTECYDDVFTNETFRLSVNQQSTSLIEVDETVLVDKSNIVIESEHDKEVMLNTVPVNQLNNCVGAVTGVERSVENPCKSIADDNNKNNDDSESDFEKNTNNNVSGSETDMEINRKQDKQVKNIAKNTGDMHDDSETDIDVEINRNRRKKLRKLRSTAVKQISDDSETDIEASSKVKSSKQKVKTVTSDSETDMDVNKPSSVTNTERSAADNIINIIDSGSETEIEDEHELLLKMKNVTSTKSAVKVPAVVVQDVKQGWSSSDDEIDLLAPVQMSSDSFTEKNSAPDKSITNETHPVKTTSDGTSVQAKRDVDDGFEDDDFDLLVPTQLLEINPAEKNRADAPTQLLVNNEETLLNSVAPTQLLEPVTARNDEKTAEEINSEAPTQLLEPVKRTVEEHLQQSLASTSKANLEDDYLAPTQLIDPAVYAKVRNEENVELDSLAPTQLLQPVQLLSGNEVPIDEAETQTEDIQPAGNEEHEDLAPTQLLKPLDSSSKHDNEDDNDVNYLAPTQKLHLNGTSVDNEANDDEEILENALTENLARQSTPNAKKSSIKQVDLADNDEDFLVPTQKLSLAGLKAVKNVSFSEDIFAAPTQMLPANEEHSIFTAPTQKLTPRKSLGMKRRPGENQDDDDDDFMAPTQLLTANKKTAEETVDLDFSINDDPNFINIDYSSEDTSMRLAVSYTDDNDFCAATQKLELPKNKSVEKMMAPSKLLSEPETQFEVEFDLETQKLYVEAATSRPNNPLANMFGEESTQLTETEDQTPTVSTELKTVTDSEQTMSSDSSFQEASKKRSIEEDAEEANTKRGRYVKLAKNQVEDGVTRRTSKRAETINSKYAKSKITNKTDDATSSPKKRGKKVEEKNAIDAVEEDNASVPSTSKLMENISEDVGKETTEKALENKLPGTPRRMSRRGRVTEERELETPRKTPARRVKKVVEKEEQEIEMLKELMQTNKSPEVKVILTKIVEDVASKAEITGEPKVEYKKPSDKQTVSKRQPRMAKKSETSAVTTRVTRNKSNSNEESSDGKSSKENVSELADYAVKTKKPQVTRKTRGKQPKKPVVDDDDEEESVVIEDSDDSTNSNIEKYIRHTVLKLDYTDESCSGSSVASVVVPNPRHSKRSLKIEDYSSDENKSESTCNSHVDTPNTKRRRYEPLNITAISQTSNSDSEPVKHKIVFTMLNNPELETTVKSLGGTTIDSVYACTALVTNKISRSLKFLIAVSLGKPIVNTKWISESVKKKMFLDPWNYILEDSESESKFKFSLSESLQRAGRKKLLTGYTILLVVNKNFDVLKEIIETCGGKCVTRAPAKSAAANVVVVAYEEDKAKYARYLKQKTPLTVVAAEAIFAGVLAQELDFNSHILS